MARPTWGETLEIESKNQAELDRAGVENFEDLDELITDLEYELAEVESELTDLAKRRRVIEDDLEKYQRAKRNIESRVIAYSNR
jgi:prefoldin subunit 5